MTLPHLSPLHLQAAWRIAVEAHALQLDKGKESYLFHVARVAMALDTPLEQVCGLLHDVLEDSPDSGAWYAVIQQEFPWAVIECCEALCRRDVEPYEAYIARLATNPLAVKVKLADLDDNLNVRRLCKLPKKEAARLQAKYLSAFAYLTKENHETQPDPNSRSLNDPSPSAASTQATGPKPCKHLGATEDC